LASGPLMSVVRPIHTSRLRWSRAGAACERKWKCFRRKSCKTSVSYQKCSTELRLTADKMCGMGTKIMAMNQLTNQNKL